VAYGHATIEATLALAEMAGVGRLVLFHHGPDRTDDGLGVVVASALRTHAAPGAAGGDGRRNGGSVSGRGPIAPDHSMTAVAKSDREGPVESTSDMVVEIGTESTVLELARQ
jgi:hypothetical protein